MRTALALIAGITATTPLTVSYTDPPQELDLTPYVSIDIPAASDLESAGAIPWAAVLPDGGVILIENSTSTAYLVGNDASVSSVELDVELGWIVASPGPVVYGLAATTDAASLDMVAVALAGPNTGRVVASSPISNPSMYLELPTDAFGSTPAGVIDRVRDPGAVMIEHVDITGDSVEVAGLTELWSITDGGVVTTPALPNVEWALDIERHPDWRIPFEGPSAPAPTANGGGVYTTTIGPPADPEGFSATMPVLAVLDPDGAGHWYSIPEDWSLVASDTDGTIFARRSGDRLELARLSDAPGDTEPPTTAAAACPSYRENKQYPLRLCDTSEGVAVAQALLNVALGTDLVLDGRFGPLTEAAVREFQDQQGLSVDGLIGPDTWNALMSFPLGNIVFNDDDGNGVVDPWEVGRPAWLPHDDPWTCGANDCGAWAVLIPVEADPAGGEFWFDGPEFLAATAVVNEAGYTPEGAACVISGTPGVVAPFATEHEAIDANAALAAPLAELGLSGVVAHVTRTCD